MQSIFQDSNFCVLPQSDIGIQEGAEETACTFIENALLKARHVASMTDHPVIADDSGLVVKLLNNEPGVLSARYAGENATDQDNILNIIEKLKNKRINQSPAKFIATVVYISDQFDPTPIITQGEINGIVIAECMGENGFGYDPMFLPEGSDKTLAEMTQKQKNVISHRGIAFRALLEKLT